MPHNISKLQAAVSDVAPKAPRFLVGLHVGSCSYRENSVNPVRYSTDMEDHGILDVIRLLSSNDESGKLQLNAGTTRGAFFFKDGKLVDARMGDLTGFRAVNAAAAIRNADYRFDPSVAPPPISSITPNERIVLKQFFGIETVDPREYSYEVAPREYSYEEEQLISDDDDEVTLVKGPVPAQVTPIPADELPLPNNPAYQPIPRQPFYRNGLFLGALALLVTVAFAALVYSFRERSTPRTSETTAVESPAQPVAEQPQPVAEQPQPVAEPVKQDRQELAQDLTGEWNVVNTVQKTSYSSFKNMQIGFKVSINQNGNGFTGTGEKISENGRSLPAGSRTPINVKGSVEGDRVEATFSEQGAARKTNGRFVWRINKAGGLTGTFVSNAARASGTSTAKKDF